MRNAVNGTSSILQAVFTTDRIVDDRNLDEDGD
jgi:hypothetical protein